MSSEAGAIQIFDKQQVQTGFEITGMFVQQVGTFLATQAKAVDDKKQQADVLDKKAADPALSETDRQALRDQAVALRTEAQTLYDQWGAGGTYRQILTALTDGASGNISGSTGQFVQNMVVNYVQQQGAEYVGKLVVDGTVKEGSPEHAALHAIIACAGAAASNQSCGSGAMGAAASSLLTGLFSAADPNETTAEQEARKNLITTLVTGLAVATGANTTTANNAATSATENNWLATQQVVQMNKEVTACGTNLLCAATTTAKWFGISAKQDYLTTTGIGKGLAESGWSDVKGLAQFMAHPIDGLNGIATLISSKEMKDQLGAQVVAELNQKIANIKTALDQGGDENAEQLGKDVGSLLWQVGSVATGAVGAATAGVALAKVGVTVTTNTLKTLSGLSKFETLFKAGGMIGSDGLPLMDFSTLTSAQKGVIGEVFGANTVQMALPGAQRISRATAIGQTGIDDLYKVSSASADYVVVEYKFGKSTLKQTADGVQMSDDWLTGVNSNYDRIAEAVGRAEASNISRALDAGRIEKWVVYTDQAGGTSIFIVDSAGKIAKANSTIVSKLLPGVLK